MSDNYRTCDIGSDPQMPIQRTGYGAFPASAFGPPSALPIHSGQQLENCSHGRSVPS